MKLMQRKEHPLDEQALKNFREYLSIPSVHPNVNYDECVKFLRKQAAEMNLPIEVYELFSGKPIVVISNFGKEPNLPSIMLNSHMDVVPAYEEYWSHPPFGAEQDVHGNIFARGAQDSKAAGIQYLEAIRRLRAADVHLRRNIHITYTPDEEIGGKEGMKTFVNNQNFKKLNIGFAFDEGLAHPENIIEIVYGERSMWQVTFHCPGKAESMDFYMDDTTGDKVRIILDKAMQYRQIQKNKLISDPSLTTGDVTSINLTMMEGMKSTELNITFDIRLAVYEDHKKIEEMLQSWCKEAGSKTYYTFKLKEQHVKPTKIDESNIWWLTFKEECNALGLNIKPVICPAAGDNRYLRQVGIPTIGFAPMFNTPVRMHDNDEFMNKEVFLQGIDIYCHLISTMANLNLSEEEMDGSV